MGWGTHILASLAAALLFAVAVFAQINIDTIAAAEEDDMLYLPNEQLLVHFTGGMDSVIADLLWLQCIQYTGEQVQTEHDYEWLGHMVNTVVRLDPYFADAYRYGALFLAALEDDSEGALDLLNRGMVQLPNNPDLPYEATMVYLLNKKDDPGARKIAALYATMASKRPNAKNHMAVLASNLQSEQDMAHLEEDMWKTRLKSEDKLIRDMADQKLRELGAKKTIEQLNEFVQQYAQRFGQVPDKLEVLISAGIVREEFSEQIQQDPMGGTYFIDGQGQVQSTSLLDGETDVLLGKLRKAIKYYEKREGTWPPSLETLVTAGDIPWSEGSLPTHPWYGKSWDYNNTTGEIQ